MFHCHRIAQSHDAHDWSKYTWIKQTQRGTKKPTKFDENSGMRLQRVDVHIVIWSQEGYDCFLLHSFRLFVNIAAISFLTKFCHFRRKIEVHMNRYIYHKIVCCFMPFFGNYAIYSTFFVLSFSLTLFIHCFFVVVNKPTLFICY